MEGCNLTCMRFVRVLSDDYSQQHSLSKHYTPLKCKQKKKKIVINFDKSIDSLLHIVEISE